MNKVLKQYDNSSVPLAPVGATLTVALHKGGGKPRPYNNKLIN